METLIDIRRRNDTRRPNSSPYTSLPSYIGIPYECSSDVTFPVEDPDDDTVRCRMAEGLECTGACTDLPSDSIWLDEVTCSVRIHAFKATGYQPDSIYRLTLVAEDFPDTVITMGSDVLTRAKSLSRVPVQVTVRVLNAPCNKHQPLYFVKPTLPNFSRSSFGMMNVLRHKPVAANFYMKADSNYDINSTEVMMSGPMHLKYSYHTDDQKTTLNRSNVIRIGVTWQPKFPDQIGNQQFCVWGIDVYGITTTARCLTSIVGDDGDFCQVGTVACVYNGTCLNVFKFPQEKCRCAPGYQSRDCSKVVHCFECPCMNNGVCTDIKSGVHCNCPKDYTGTLCEHKLPPCRSSPCHNNATCIDTKSNFKCICGVNYTGAVCDDEVKNISKDDQGSGGLVWDWDIILPVAIGSALATVLIATSMLVINGSCKKAIGAPAKTKPDDDAKNRTPVEILNSW